MSYSFVIPCYCSSHTIREVVESTIQEMERIDRKPYEFILVDDHSPDEGATLQELKALANEYSCVKAIELAKNSGQHNASIAGMNYAKGDYIISMDDDLQTRPSQLPKLFEEIEKGYDVVYGYYPEKKHSRFRNFGSWVHFESIRILIGKPKGMKTSSFFVMRKIRSGLHHPVQRAVHPSAGAGAPHHPQHLLHSGGAFRPSVRAVRIYF